METSRDDFVIAIRSAFLRKGNKQRFSLLSLILFSIIILVLGNFNSKVVKFNKSIIKEIIYFSSFIITVPENTIKKSISRTSEHFTYYGDYQIAKNELQNLKNKDLSKKIIIYENIELKKLIEDYFVEDSQVYAKVLIDKESPFLRSIIINKGSKNDVRVGMIVYDDNYLIGRVVEVNFLTSRVLLISDINSKVPVTIQPLNIEAIMSGLSKQQGRLQYIKGEKLINKDNQELIVVTSGSGGIFKSGIPIGKINTIDILKNNQIIVDFYRDFSQLKYVKILSYKKEKIKLDESNKIIFETSDSQITEMNNQEKNIKILQQQRVITKEIRDKLGEENTKLKKQLIISKKKLKEQSKKIKKDQSENENLEFLKLNLLHGHKCRKTFFKPNLYKINTLEYKNCVFKKGPIK
jgi:rod shape-determining protein MreC